MKRKIYGSIIWGSNTWWALTNAPVGVGNTLDQNGKIVSWDLHHDTWVVVDPNNYILNGALSEFEPHLVYLPKGMYVFTTSLSGKEIRTNEPEEEIEYAEEVGFPFTMNEEEFQNYLDNLIEEQEN